MVVIRDEPNDKMCTFVNYVWESQDVYVVLIPLHRLQFNILKHQMVPKHRILSKAEAKEVIERYNATPEMFPRLSRFDPVALAIGIRPGQICEI